MSGSLLVGMIACPRADVAFGQALEWIREGGFSEEIHCFAEPGVSRPKDAGVDWHLNKRRIGAYANYKQALIWMLRQTKEDHLLLVEDDVEFCAGAREALFRGIEQYPNYSSLSLYLSARETLSGRVWGTGWEPYNLGNQAWGTLAICYRREGGIARFIEEVKYVAEDPFCTPYDARIFAFFERVGSSCYAHNPSLTDHRGKNSLIGHQKLPVRLETKVGDLSKGFGFDKEWRGGSGFSSF